MEQQSCVRTLKLFSSPGDVTKVVLGTAHKYSGNIDIPVKIDKLLVDKLVVVCLFILIFPLNDAKVLRIL